jgi:MarR family transcriptional regulator, organic hydroperoxide resistance regulator
MSTTAANLCPTVADEMSSPESWRFERAFARLWAALRRGEDPDLSQHERELLRHVPAHGGVHLNEVAWTLTLPKSTASVLVKGLERRGFLVRRRDPNDERRLAITLTQKGRDRVAGDSVLELRRLGEALAHLSAQERQALLEVMDKLAAACLPRGQSA